MRPIAFYSKHLNKAQMSYSAVQREALALVMAVKHFKIYLYGQHFTVYTDHKPLKWMLKETNSDLVNRWLNELDNYKFTIKYKAGKENGGADGLSRMPNEDMTIDQPVEEINEWPIRRIKLSQKPEWITPSDQQQDKEIMQILEALMNNDKETADKFKVKDELLYKTDTDGDKLVIPQSHKQLIMEELHDSQRGGHFGTRKTQRKIKERFYWKNQSKEVKEYIKSCTTCQAVKAPHATNNPPIQPLRSTGVWNLIASDFLGPFPLTKNGNKHILVFCDHFSKWAIAYATRDQLTTTVAECFITLVSSYGIPENLLTDQGRNFEAILYQDLLELLDVKKLRTTA